MQNQEQTEQVENIQAVKTKRVMNDKQKENLAKGREKAKETLRLKREQAQKDKEELIEQMAIKKANSLIKSKLKLKKDFKLEEADDEDEDIIVPIQPKKPKKKQIVYLPPESDSEEEIVYKKEMPSYRKPQRQRAPTQEQINVVPDRKLVFF